LLFYISAYTIIKLIACSFYIYNLTFNH